MLRVVTRKLLMPCIMLSTFLIMPPLESAETRFLNLDEAVSLALENNRLIEQRIEDREAARWNLSAVRRSAGLRLSWSMSANRIGGRYYHGWRNQRYQLYGLSPEELKANHVKVERFPLYQSSNSNSLTLSFPLYTGGQLENQREHARYGLNAADLNLEDARQQVKWRTAQAYYQALNYRDTIEVRQEAINLLNEHLRNVQIQFEVGTVALADVLATNVQLANSQQAYNSAQGNYENALATLNNLIGLPADTNLILAGEQKYSAYTKSEEDCLNYALSHRPDGISAMYAVKQAEAAVGSSKAGFRPNISAVVQGSITGEGAFKADQVGGQERWSAGIQLSWNIFDNNVTSAQVQQAKAQKRKAESVARQQIEQIQLEIRQAYTNLKSAEKNIAVTHGAVKQAEEQFLIAQVRYEEGVDTNLNVMDAQEKLTEARINYSAAIFNFNTSKAQLEKAMGIPTNIDAAIYAQSVEAGKNANEALKDSAQVPLKIFDDKGKIKRRSDQDIRPTEKSSNDTVEPFAEEKES